MDALEAALLLRRQGAWDLLGEPEEGDVGGVQREGHGQDGVQGAERVKCRGGYGDEKKFL